MKKMLLFIALLASMQSMGQINIGLETAIAGTNGKITDPGDLLGQVFEKATSGVGRELEVGFVITYKEKVSLGVGYKSWNMPFDHTVNGIIVNDIFQMVELDKISSAQASENGILHYSGIYIKADYRMEYVFFTTGFDISTNNTYKNDLIIWDANGDVFQHTKNRETSILTDRFNQQVNWNIGLGPTFEIAGLFRLKATIGYLIPIVQIYDTGYEVEQIQIGGKVDGDVPNAQLDLGFLPRLRFGVGIEYQFGKTKKSEPVAD